MYFIILSEKYILENRMTIDMIRTKVMNVCDDVNVVTLGLLLTELQS